MGGFDRLKELEYFFRLTPDIFCIAQLDGTITQRNQNLPRILGYTKKEFQEEFQQQTSMIDLGNQLIHPEDQEISMQVLQEALQGKSFFNHENRFRCKDGSYKWISWNFSPLPEKELIYLVGRDVTYRKIMEEKLSKSQQKIISIFESITDGFFALDHQWRFTYMNKTTETTFNQFLGKTKEEMIGKSFWELFPSIFGSSGHLKCQKAMENNIPVHLEVQSPFINSFYEVNAYPGPEGLSFYWQDITKRKQAEESLRLSKEILSKAFHSSPSMMGIKRVDNLVYVDVNESFARCTGYSREEIIGRSVVELNIWSESENQHNKTIMETLQREGKISNIENEFRTKSGETRVALISAVIIKIGGTDHILVTANDITELKKFQKEMAQLSRLNLIGQMAAGIGHEIRNPMTTIRGFLQLLSRKEDCAPYKNYYDIMIEELDRCNSIITEFLSLGQSKSIQLKQNNLNKVVESLFPLMMADALNRDQNINLELGKVSDLMLNENEIRQLILNLVRNGLEAMPAGGTLNIKTYLEKENVVLLVQDQGKGIDFKVLEKIGTPFFTTKKDGIGLGLAVCYSIAARHQAQIEVKTTSSGTTFLVYFN